ncbi:MAG: hypothetical protein QOG87_183 [Actinomycetota bacterium]
MLTCALGACGDSEPNTATTTSAPSSTGLTVDERGVGKLRLGMSLADAKASGEIGPTGPGCEVAGPSELGAPLQLGEVVGNVTFRDGVLYSVSVRSGAKTAAGVGPGSTIPQIQQAYGSGYEVKVDHATEAQFGITLVSVLRDGTQLFDFDVATDTGKATSVIVPRITFCE